MSQHFRLLGRKLKECCDCDNHAHGRHMHTRMSLLRRKDIQSTPAAGSPRTRKHS